MSIKNNRGFSLMEALIASGILVGGLMTVVGIITAQQKMMSGQIQSASVSFMRQNIVNLITTQGAWNKTRELNSEMSCMRTYPSTCTNGQTAQINLYAQDGSLVVDTKNPSGGLRQNGKVCSGYDASGANDCGVRAVVTWEVACSSATSCQYPQELVSVNFTQKNFLAGIFSSLSGFDINKMARVDMGDNQSPLINCVKIGKMFVGFDKSYTSASGVAFAADAKGCIDTAAFKGKQGDPGLAGHREIAVAPTPTPVPTPTPAPTPTIVCRFDNNNYYKFIDSPYLGCGSARCEVAGMILRCQGAGPVVNGVSVSASATVYRGALVARGKVASCQKGNLGRVDLYQVCSLR